MIGKLDQAWPLIQNDSFSLKYALFVIAFDWFGLAVCTMAADNLHPQCQIEVAWITAAGKPAG